MILADLIFPIFTVPYFWFLEPWALPVALLLEALVFWYSYRKISSIRLAAGVLGANAFSWFVGIILILFAPFNYLGFGYLGISQDQNFQIRYHQPYILIAFFVAWILSAILELMIWKLLDRKEFFPCLARTTLAANAASYLFLLGCLYVYQGFSFEN